MKKSIAIFLFFSIAALLFGCGKDMVLHQTEAGVTVDGAWTEGYHLSVEEKIRIKNNNDFVVSVRRVLRGRGEITTDFFYLSPGEKKEAAFIYEVGFHIYKDGVQIGFLVPRPEKK